MKEVAMNDVKEIVENVEDEIVTVWFQEPENEIHTK